MLDVIKHWLTARNGVDWSMTKLIGASGGLAMIGKFLTSASADYTGFGAGIALVMAALAAKYMVEKKEE